MPQGWQFGSRTNGTRYEAGLIGGGKRSGAFLRQLCGLHIQGIGLIRQIVLCQYNGGRSKGVGFDHIGSRCQKAIVDIGHRFRLRFDQIFVTAFILGSPKICGGEVLGLQVGSHPAIEDDHGSIGTVKTVEKRTLHGEFFVFQRNCLMSSVIKRRLKLHYQLHLPNSEEKVKTGPAQNLHYPE